MKSVFDCIITGMKDVNVDNLSKWKKLLKSASFPSLLPVHKRILARYGVSSIDEYYEMIEIALSGNNISKIVELYNIKKNSEVEKDSLKEKENLKKKIHDSIRTISENTVIRMLTDDDEDDATSLYIMFKETMEEDIEEARNYTQDFILKNIMYGIFIDEILVGFVIIHYSRQFQTDFQSDKINTFYIQELLIHPEYRGQKLSKYLLEYCIYRCPKDKNYMSLMTTPGNIPLIKVAKSVGFVEQEVVSGDSKHSLLMIKNMDKIENMSYIKSPSKSPKTLSKTPSNSPSKTPSKNKSQSSSKTRSMYPTKSSRDA